MIRRLIFLVVSIISIIIGLSIYLQPDNLRDCEKSPGVNSSCSSVDAIVAISGGDTVARANQAIELFKDGWSNVLIFSGDAIDENSPSNAYVMQQLAISAGVPAESIYIDEKADSTKQNAENTQLIFAELGINKIILVTSGYHQRRASLEFEKYTQDVVILNHPVLSDKDWSVWWWLTPRGWWLAGSEFAKIIVLKVVGA
jgi:uncharacterized SAM-binding protein YcdF (DUF218 family)